jgi:hypothetical protein
VRNVRLVLLDVGLDPLSEFWVPDWKAYALAASSLRDWGILAFNCEQEGEFFYY